MARAIEDVRRPALGERLPPQNLEAEASVLGSMLVSPDAIADVIEVLQADDFYRSAHTTLYEAIRGLYARGEPVDQLTIKDALQRAGTLEAVGGPLVLHELVETVPTPASAGYYARMVAETALRRRLIGAAADIIDLAYGGRDDADTIADDAEQRIYDVARREDKDDMAVLRDLVDHAMLELESIQNRDSTYTGLATGFRDLDELMSGLQPGNLVIIAARPGIGKSSLAVNIARNVCVDGHSVALFSLEMSRAEIGMRMLCAEARVPWDRIRNKRVDARDWSEVVRAAEILHDAPMHIVDAGNVNIVDIRAKARRMRSSRRSLSLIIVDYLQLMTSPAARRPDNRQQEVAEISRSLKLLAKELQIPVIALSQLNRNPEARADKRPQLSDLRECVSGDTLVQLADGARLPVRDLVGTEPDVLAVSRDGRLMEARADRVWPVGIRPIFEVKLASGRTVRATAEHRFLAGSGWKQVSSTRSGDRLAISRRLPEPAQAKEWPDDRLALLGQLIGDGSYLSGQPMRYTTASEANSEMVTRAATSQFGARVRRYRGRGAWHQLCIAGNGNRWHPAGVNRWLRGLGIFGQRSHQKRVPAEVFQLGNRSVSTLLRHLWATDGCIHVCPPGGRGGHNVYFSTSSRGLADDVATLLLRFGIVVRIAEVRKPGYRPWWHVYVSGAVDQRWFLRSVGSFGPRVEPARRLEHALRDVVPNTNVDTLPIEIFDRVRTRMAAIGMTQRAMTSRRGTSYGGSSHFRFSPSRRLVEEYATVLDDSELLAAAQSDLFWDRVVSIEPCGSEPVFDLTVPGPASWLAGAGGVVSHNSGSLEQDSDVVMFIHRDDQDPAKANEVDLIVAKHRNGPTGKVPLHFEPSLTQFRNAARGTQEPPPPTYA